MCRSAAVLLLNRACLFVTCIAVQLQATSARYAQMAVRNAQPTVEQQQQVGDSATMPIGAIAGAIVDGIAGATKEAIGVSFHKPCRPLEMPLEK
eukprot:354963-Pelagomonas_calceolata.AAC.1